MKTPKKATPKSLAKPLAKPLTKREDLTGAVKVMVFGLGYIGRMVVEALLSENPFWNRRLALVGVIDIVPESRAWATKNGIAAFASLEDLLKSVRPDVCIHTTASSIDIVVEQLNELIAAKIPVVSSAEELFYPWIQHKEVAHSLHQACKDHQVAVMGTGANPGFVMDVLPAMLTQMCHTVDLIRVERVVDAATRRLPLQKKIGAGLDLPKFRAQLEKGKIGHVGLMESLDYLAQFMGVKLTRREQTVEPIVTPKSFATRVATLKKGQVCGIHHQAFGEVDRKRVIELDLKISLLAEAPSDIVTIQGTPPITLTIDNGVQGDQATVAALVRGIPIVMQSKPGVVRQLDRDHFI